MDPKLTIQNPLGTEKINRLLLQFSVPTTLTLLVNYLYNIVDQIFIGQWVGVPGIAATNVAFPLTILSTAFALLIGDGCAAVISLSLGRNEQEKADQTVTQGILLLIIGSIFIVILTQVFLPQMILLFGATETAFQPAMDYLRIVILGLPFMILCCSLTSIIRADGNPKFTMKCMILGAIINLLLDPLFIFVLGMGMQGAAIATILGQIVSGLLCFSYLSRLKHFHVHRSDLLFSGKTSAQILSLGFPSMITQLCTAMVQIVMNNLMRQYGALTVYGSDITLSVYGMMMKVYQLSHSMFVGVSSATQPINGYNFGAKLFHRVKKTYQLAASAAFLLSVFWFCVFQLLGKSIGMLFVPDDPLYAQFSQHCFHLYMMAFFLYGVPMTTASFFQGIGSPMKSLTISLMRQAVFLIPLALILSGRYGLDGALIAAPIADVLTFLLAMVFIAWEYVSWKRKEML